jgi:TolB-like protein/DNA-binding winged helix-turn-helix (wHTH) protein/tetratricopeptide (TPR) repeat protein
VSEEIRPKAATEGFRDSPAVAKETPGRETLRIYEFGRFRLDPSERKLLRANEIVALTPRAFDTLHLLVRNSGHVLEKDELIRILWPDTFVEEGSLSNHIFLLRKALGDSQAFIETVPRRGYRFVGAVRQFAFPDAVVTEKRPEVGSLGIASLPAKVRRPWRSRAVLAMAAATVLASLAGAGWFYLRAGRGGETIDSVAVLPFVNASADPNTEYLSDGITESLINSLSQLPHLKVMSRDAAFRYKGKETDAQTVGRDLGVRAVFEGRVMQRGDTLTISAELIDTRDNSHIWGQQYSRKPSDIFGLQDEIAREMTTALRLRLTAEEQRRLVKSYTSNPEAYQDYLRGRFFWQKTTGLGLNKGAEYFQQAISKDPRYAQAYDGLADSYISLAVYGFSPPQEAYPKAREAALTSLEIDGTLAEAHTSLARIKAEYDWDWSGAEREFQRAIELNPNYPTAYQMYGLILSTMGRPEEAIANYKRGLELDPLSPLLNGALGEAFYYTRQYDQAIEQLQKTLELDPNLHPARAFLADAYLHKSMSKEATEELEKHLVIAEGRAWALAELGYVYAVMGRRPDALKLLNELNQLSREKFVPADAMAQIYVGLGEKDKAFEWLEKGYERHSLGLAGVDLKVDPVWDPLRSDPRFGDLLRHMNLQQ